MNGGVARFLAVGCRLAVGILTGADQAAAAGPPESYTFKRKLK